MPNLRQREILDVLTIKGRCSLAELAEEFNVSAETIRRDVKSLAEEGLVEPVRGGVALPEVLRETAFHYCLLEQVDAKKTIARRAAAEVANGEVLLIGGGSTTTYFAHALRHHMELTVITNSVDIARMLIPRNGNRVYCVGGALRSMDGAVLGPLAVEFVRRFSAKKTFFSVAEVDLADGLMHDAVEDVEIVRAMMERAERRYLLCDQSKFGRRGLLKLAAFDEVDALVTESEPAPEFRRRLEEAGVEVLIAPVLAAAQEAANF